MQIKFLIVAGLAGVALAGCADSGRTSSAAPTAVTRDYWRDPVSQSTTARDADRSPVTTNSAVASPRSSAYSGSGAPPANQRELAIRAARHPECRATALHQDRPGGSNYDPARGAPSCIDLLGR